MNKKLTFYPGSQRKIYRADLTSITLYFLLIVFLTLSIYSILFENVLLLPIPFQKYFVLKLLDIKTAFPLLVSVISLILVRYHFLIGFQPRLNYESQIKNKGENILFKNSVDIWNVTLKNVGLGAAIVEKLKFRLNINDEYNLSLHEVLKKLESDEYKINTNIFINNITNGYTITPKDNILLFEIELNNIKELSVLDMQITFKGFLGARFVKEIFFIPRNETAGFDYILRYLNRLPSILL